MANTLIIYRGDTLIKTILIGTLDETSKIVCGVDLRTFGNLCQAQLRKTEDSDTFTALTVDFSDAEHGNIKISLTSEETATLSGKGVWDLQIVDTSVLPHAVKTFVSGTFTIIKDVTR